MKVTNVFRKNKKEGSIFVLAMVGNSYLISDKYNLILN